MKKKGKPKMEPRKGKEEWTTRKPQRLRREREENVGPQSQKSPYHTSPMCLIFICTFSL
jgi:hypothetical protein